MGVSPNILTFNFLVVLLVVMSRERGAEEWTPPTAVKDLSGKSCRLK